ncbi:cytochrome c oxidase subunit II [Rhodobacteraceae bacterium WD3A24]|nr:cytochrome c oxidase subunit II [Rhodobacteraceae bacterium WD3A24]
MRLTTTFSRLIGSICAISASGAALAQESAPERNVVGAPDPAGINMQHSATELARDIVWLDNMLLWIITPITIFVLLLLAFVILRYNKRMNPNPARFTHNSPLEVTWTVVPILILVFIGAFSLPILFKQQEIPEADVTVKVTGYQWYWGYEYVDHDFGFSSFMLERDQLEEHGFAPEHYLLATDTEMVVPVDSTIVVQVTGADVIHSWTVPAFGVKQDAVPGRLAELWFEAEEEGTYFGQCSELCGINHAYMPITVRVVSQEEYEAWLDESIEQYAGTPRDGGEAVRVAAND